MPVVAAELRRYAGVLERHYRDCCDIEFTIERGRLWMLQVRVGKRTPQAALRMAVEMAEDPAFPLTREEAVRRVAATSPTRRRIVADRADRVRRSPVVSGHRRASLPARSGSHRRTPSPPRTPGAT